MGKVSQDESGLARPRRGRRRGGCSGRRTPCGQRPSGAESRVCWAARSREVRGTKLETPEGPCAPRPGVWTWSEGSDWNVWTRERQSRVCSSGRTPLPCGGGVYGSRWEAGRSGTSGPRRQPRAEVTRPEPVWLWAGRKDAEGELNKAGLQARCRRRGLRPTRGSAGAPVAGGAIARRERTQSCSFNVIHVHTATALPLPSPALTQSLGTCSLRRADKHCRPTGPASAFGGIFSKSLISKQ